MKLPIHKLLSRSLSPCAHYPLVSTTFFTRWLHLVLSAASLYKVQVSFLYQSTRLSIFFWVFFFYFRHHFYRRELALAACHFSFCMMWPKKFNFLLIMLWTILMFVPVVSVLTLFFVQAAASHRQCFAVTDSVSEMRSHVQSCTRTTRRTLPISLWKNSRFVNQTDFF